MTPVWAAEEIVSHYFADLTENDRVVEPSCGIGRFLAALPAHVLALGVDIDPALARINGEGSVWSAVTQAALEKLGGEASVARILEEIAGHCPTDNPHWTAKVRQTLQRKMVSPCRGMWKRPEMTVAWPARGWRRLA